jgi:hypothetical protein
VAASLCLVRGIRGCGLGRPTSSNPLFPDGVVGRGRAEGSGSQEANSDRAGWSRTRQLHDAPAGLWDLL